MTPGLSASDRVTPPLVQSPGECQEPRLATLKPFLVFLVLSVIAQTLFLVDLPGSGLVAAIGVLVLCVSVLAAPPSTGIVLVMLLALTQVQIPGSEREVQELVVPLCSAILLVKAYRRNGWKVLRVSWSAGVFYIACLVVFFYGIEGPQSVLARNPDNISGFHARWGLFQCIIYFFAVVATFDLRDFSLFLKGLTAVWSGAMAIALLMLLLGIEELPLFNSFTWKVLTELGGSHRVGILSVAGLGVSLLALANPLQWSRRKRWGYLLLSAGSLILSGGRSSLLALVAGTFTLIGARRRRLLAMSGAAMACVLFLVWFSFSPFVKELPVSIQRLVVVLPSEVYQSESIGTASSSAAAESSSWRYVLWAAAALSIEEHPLTGVGFGVPVGADKLELNDADAFTMDFLVTGNTHNTFVSIAYLMGIPIALVFLFWVSSMIWWSTRAVSRKEGKTGGHWAEWLLLLAVTNAVLAFTEDIFSGLAFTMAAALVELTRREFKPGSGTTPPGRPEPERVLPIKSHPQMAGQA